MKYAAFLLLSLFSLNLTAGVVALPLGGKVNVGANEWNIQETGRITGKNSLLFAHKKLNLQGILLDGSIREKGECKSSSDSICERIVPMGEKVSYQIICQRFHGAGTFQNYVIAFTIDKGQEKALLPVLRELKTKMEFLK